MKAQPSLKKSATKASADRVVRNIRRQTRRHFSAEDKIRIAQLCRKEGIAQSLNYTWSKAFMEAGKRRLAGDTARAATSGKVQDLRREAGALKECVADLTLENRLLRKKRDHGGARPRMRYPASEKLEIIRFVEQSHLPAKRTLDKLGIARRTFYRWYDHYLEAYSTTSRATSSPGSCAPTCGPRMSPIRWTSPWRLPAATAPRCCTSPDCLAIMAPGTSPANWRNMICPLLSGPSTIVVWTTKEEWNGSEAQARGDHRQAA